MRWSCSLVASLAACGGSSNTPQPLDAAVDAADAVNDAGTPIRITVFDYQDPQTPLPFAKVDFVAPDGTIQTVMTDANGVAEAVSPANTTVVTYQTKLPLPPAGPLVRSFAGANPGDSIIAGHFRQQAFPTLGDVTFELPAVTGAANYEIVVTCSPTKSQPGGLSFTMHVVACPLAAHANAIAWAESATGQLLGGPSTLVDLDLTTRIGTTVTMPAYDPAPITITSELTNIPAGSTDMQWSTLYFRGADLTFVGSVSSPPASQMQILGVGDHTLSQLLFKPPVVGAANYDMVYTRVDATRVTDFQLDASTMMRPMSDVKYDALTHSIVWTEQAGRAATLLNATMTVTTNGVDKVHIELHAPHGASLSIPLPALPPELQPNFQDHIVVYPLFQLFDGVPYSAQLTTVDTNPGFTPVGWDPAFLGSVWEAR